MYGTADQNSFHRILILYCGCEVIELSYIQCMALQIRTVFIEYSYCTVAVR